MHGTDCARCPQAGHLDFINEIRPLTCIFLGFPSLLDERDGVPHEEQVRLLPGIMARALCACARLPHLLVQLLRLAALNCHLRAPLHVCAPTSQHMLHPCSLLPCTPLHCALRTP